MYFKLFGQNISVDQLINFSQFGLDHQSSDYEDYDDYDLTSELFLENVDDDFMPNFPNIVSPPISPARTREELSSHHTSRNSGILHRINSNRQRNNNLYGRRNSLHPEYPRTVSGSHDFTLQSAGYSTARMVPTGISEHQTNRPNSRGRPGRYRRSNMEQRSGSRHSNVVRQ